jgi:hypothetical protein
MDEDESGGAEDVDAGARVPPIVEAEQPAELPKE